MKWAAAMFLSDEVISDSSSDDTMTSRPSGNGRISTNWRKALDTVHTRSDGCGVGGKTKEHEDYQSEWVFSIPPPPMGPRNEPTKRSTIKKDVWVRHMGQASWKSYGGDHEVCQRDILEDIGSLCLCRVVKLRERKQVSHLSPYVLFLFLTAARDTAFGCSAGLAQSKK